MIDDEEPSAEELAAAARLAEALDDPAAEMIRAATGKAASLGELRARALVRSALTPRRRRRWPLVAVALMAVAILLVLIGREPERPRSHSAGLLVPGPFPAQQTAADRLDLVTADRLVALRDTHYRGAP
jgi:hypothetical protein